MLTFYPGGFRSPPPGRIGFLDPGYDRVKGILWQKYKLGLKVVVFIDEIDGETHFAQLGSSWPGEPKMSQK